MVQEFVLLRCVSSDSFLQQYECCIFQMIHFTRRTHVISCWSLKFSFRIWYYCVLTVEIVITFHWWIIIDVADTTLWISFDFSPGAMRLPFLQKGAFCLALLSISPFCLLFYPKIIWVKVLILQFALLVTHQIMPYWHPVTPRREMVVLEIVIFSRKNQRPNLLWSKIIYALMLLNCASCIFFSVFWYIRLASLENCM